MMKVRTISEPLARLTWLRSSPRYRHHTSADSVMASTTPGNSPPVNSAEIETPVTEPMVIRTRLGGIVSVCAPVAASKGEQITWPGTTLLHFRKQHRRHRGHVGGF